MTVVGKIEKGVTVNGFKYSLCFGLIIISPKGLMRVVDGIFKLMSKEEVGKLEVEEIIEL